MNNICWPRNTSNSAKSGRAWLHTSSYTHPHLTAVQKVSDGQHSRKYAAKRLIGRQLRHGKLQMEERLCDFLFTRISKAWNRAAQKQTLQMTRHDRKQQFSSLTISSFIYLSWWFYSYKVKHANVHAWAVFQHSFNSYKEGQCNPSSWQNPTI